MDCHHPDLAVFAFLEPVVEGGLDPPDAHAPRCDCDGEVGCEPRKCVRGVSRAGEMLETSERDEWENIESKRGRRNWEVICAYGVNLERSWSVQKGMRITRIRPSTDLRRFSRL
jgi:hypothetical protein